MSADRTALGRFVPGKSGHPGGAGPGRPPGLASHIKEKTNDCREIADFMLLVMKGKAIVDDETGEAMAPQLRDRMEAAKWLTDRALGKALELVATPDDRAEAAKTLLEGMSSEDLRALVLVAKPKG